MEKKLFLIDGHSLIFRMYYAFMRHPMINSKGMDVSILFGFTKYILELVQKQHPTHLAVCFDPPGKTFRHQMFPDYKGTRQAAPELVIEALEPLTKICKAMQIPVLMVPGFEGDDVLGSMAVRSAAEGFQVYMVTPDKDFGQLITDKIYQFKPGKSGGEDEVWTPAEICAKFKLKDPLQVIDILTLCGDTADNVPGVSGVGEVGASKLIAQWGSVENIYANLGSLTARQQELFKAAEPHIALSKELVTIKTDIPLEPNADDMLIRTEHKAEVMELFDFYEFDSLKKYITLAEGEQVTQAETVTLQWKVVPPAELCEAACKAGAVCILVDGESDSIFARIINITCAVCRDGDNLVSEGSAQDFASIISDTSIAKCGFNLKLADNMLRAAGVQMNGPLNDIELMHYLVNPEKSHKVEVLSRSYIGVNLDDDDEPMEPQADFGLFDMVEDDAPAKPKSRFKEAVAMFLLVEPLKKELSGMAMEQLYHQIEEPLIGVLGRMEREGVKVDMAVLRESEMSLREEMVQIEDRIRATVGEPDLNVSSPKQIGQLLFEKLRIDPRMKPKTDQRYVYPTDEETLMAYADTNPIIYDILDFRGVRKLIGTYIEPFGGWISPRDGRIHTTFNQALTATGRLSSSKPNLQNIPIRTDRGKEIRRAFVAGSPDRVIVSADYSQIELRLMAHFCGDHHLCEAFCNGEDVHAITASKIFKVPVEEVTAEMRRTAKTANFGIMYGISAFGLAQRLHIPRVAAKKLIEDYFESFPLIGAWIEKTKADALRDGYVQTLFGRRRYLPEIGSRNATTRALAERNAVNAPIQGTAADIIKMAMIRVDQKLRAAGLQSRMVLQIHDELVFEAPRSEVNELMEIIKREMENVITISVPLTVECNYGENWLEAH